MKFLYLATFTSLLAITTNAHSAGLDGRGQNPGNNNLLIVPNIPTQPQNGTIANGPNGLVTTQSGSMTYYSNGPSSITNGNKTI